MLPIRRVILYKHGVGYFERQGTVDGDSEVTLAFRASEMNDVLKSLTTLDLTGGHVASISYESTAPLSKQLEDIAIRLPEKNAASGLLGDVQGARIAVELAGERVEGVGVGIETVEQPADGAKVTRRHLALLVDGSSLRTFDLQEVERVELLDESVRKDLGHLLEILIGAKKKDLKKLTIFAHGDGERELLAAYTVETPVWKTSYRILLPGPHGPEAEAGGRGNTPVIQGWALVDNTQDEDWENVQLSLVAGLPVSFVHDLYSPRYRRRPVVEVREEEAYGPPVLEDAVATGGFADPVPVAAAAPLAYESAPPPSMMRASRARAAQKRAVARESSNPVETRTAEIGDLFEYAIEKPVTVRRNQSALVPILQTAFEGRRVAIYSPTVREKNPMSAVLFHNTTDMTLEGGPVTVLEEETYVGEAMLETLAPGAERLVPYSVELGCVVSVDHRSRLEDVRRVTIVDGTLHLHRHRLKTTIYRVLNKGGRTIDLFLEHRFEKGWKLVDTPDPAEETENLYRFRFDVPGSTAPQGATHSFEVHERGDESQTFALADLRKPKLAAWFERTWLDEETHATLAALLELRERIGALEGEIADLEARVEETFTNQQRIRENLGALGDSQQERKLRERYVSRMAEDEELLERTRADVADRKSEAERLRKDLRRRIRAVRYAADV